MPENHPSITNAGYIKLKDVRDVLRLFNGLVIR